MTKTFRPFTYLMGSKSNTSVPIFPQFLFVNLLSLTQHATKRNDLTKQQQKNSHTST